VAVVGLSDNPARDSHRVASYLQQAGYRIFPVNPRIESTLGVKAVAALNDLTEPVGLVDVFRNASAAPEIARQAVAAGARFLWLQQGIISAEAARIAAAGGLGVIMDCCLMVEHRRYRDELPVFPADSEH
jgi:predicted CoA-binding protein